MAAVTSKGTVIVHRNSVNWIAGALIIIGALNRGLVGLAQIDLVAAIFGGASMMARVVYTLVGIAGMYMLVHAFARRDHGLANR